MFQREQRENRPLVSQVAMIESRFEHQNADFFEAVKMPATIFRRSPLKERNSNTSRQGTPVKKSPSPIMSRRQSNVSTRSFLHSQAQPVPLIKTSKMRMTVRQNVQISRPGKEQMLEIVGNIKQVPVIKTDREQPSIDSQTKYCSNNIHDLKIATYIIQSQNQQMMYCQKCAILLASQGFKVTKLSAEPTVNQPLEQSNARSLTMSLQSTNMRNQALNQIQNTQRRSELTLFLNDIKSLFYQFKQRKTKIKSIVQSNKTSSKDLNKSITQYFNQIIKIIEIQKNLVLQQLETQRNRISQQMEIENKQINEYMDDCSMMSDDIFSSIDLIKHIEDKAFRKVMQTYQIKTKTYLQLVTKPLPTLMTKQTLTPPDLKKVSEQIMKLTEVTFLQQQNNPIQDKVIFSFDRQKPQQNSEVDQRYMKKFDDSNDGC